MLRARHAFSNSVYSGSPLGKSGVPIITWLKLGLVVVSSMEGEEMLAHHIRMQSFDVIRIQDCDASNNKCSPVAALHDVLIIRQSLHELVHDLRVLYVLEPSLVRIRREPIPGKRGRDHIEAGLVECWNCFIDLRKVTRPPMEKQQRDGVWFGRLGMHEMHLQLSKSVYGDGGFKLRILVQASFFFSPVVGGTPELDQFVDLVHGDAIVFSPLLVGNVRGKTSELEFALEEVELGIRDVDLASWNR